MASYVLDTNVVAALMRGEGETEDRLLREKPNEVYLVQPVIAEVEYCLARLPRSRRRSELAKRFSLLAGLLPRAHWSDEVSQSFGSVKAELERLGQRIEDFDVAIAAHAIAIDATLATRNIAHFNRVSRLECESW
jgi:tRNA(fMet)-specific endonuclease VapC